MPIKAEPGGIIERLASGYTESGAEFSVLLEKGERFFFRSPSGSGELNAIRADAQRAAARYKSKSVPETLRAYLTGDEATYYYVAVLARMSTGYEVDGERVSEAVSEGEWLAMSARLPMVFDAVRRQVDGEVTVLAVAAAAQAIEAKKKPSGTTGSSETG